MAYESLTLLPQSLDDSDFAVLAATAVLSDLMEKCPPAEACRDAFERMSKAHCSDVHVHTWLWFSRAAR